MVPIILPSLLEAFLRTTFPLCYCCSCFESLGEVPPSK